MAGTTALRGAYERTELFRNQVAVAKLAGSELCGSGRLMLVHDAASGVAAEQVKRNLGGADTFKTIQKALNATRSGLNDYIFLMPKDSGASWSHAVDLTLDAKDFIHLIGLTLANEKPHIFFSTANKLLIGGTGACVGLELANIKLTNDATDSPALELASGLRCFIHDCIIAAKTTATMDVEDATREALYKRCQFGDNVAHNVVKQYVDSVNQSRTIWEDCLFLNAAAAGTDVFIEVHAASIVNIARRCMFWNNSGGTTDMAQAFTNAIMLAEYCTFWGVTELDDAASKTWFAPTGVGRLAAAGDVYNPGIAVDANGIIEATDN